MPEKYTVTLNEKGCEPIEVTLDARNEAEALELARSHDSMRHALRHAAVRAARPNGLGGADYVLSIGVLRIVAGEPAGQ